MAVMRVLWDEVDVHPSLSLPAGAREVLLFPGHRGVSPRRGHVTDSAPVVRPGAAPAEVEDAPVVKLVSSLDRWPVPSGGRWETLAARARAAGWESRAGWSMVFVLDEMFKNGKLKKAAHARECVGVWLRRSRGEGSGARRACAMWVSSDGGKSWGFWHALLDGRKIGVTDLLAGLDEGI